MKTGYLPHETVKGLVFYIITACIILSTGAGILLAWGSLAEIVANRIFYSTAILAFGSFCFLLTNYLFGNLERDLFPPKNTENMPTDPAFADSSCQSEKHASRRKRGDQSQLIADEQSPRKTQLRRVSLHRPVSHQSLLHSSLWLDLPRFWDRICRLRKRRTRRRLFQFRTKRSHQKRKRPSRIL